MRTKARCIGRLAFVLFCAYCVGVSTPLQAQDSLLHGDTIREVSVKGHRLKSYLLDAPLGTTVVDLRLMDQLPRILGNADPMHYAQLLPGVQTNSEYDAGLHIQGCDNAHNLVTIQGVPLYNVAHLLGFFSVFNTPHFSSMQLTKSPSSAAVANRLGGVVSMLMADTLRSRVSGDVSLGPISSQATLRLPVGRRSLLTVSARQAYLNLLYGRWLKIDEEQFRYSFGDYNLTWQYQPDERHTLSLDFYHGYDRAGYADDYYVLDTRLRWGNTMAALHAHSLIGSHSQLDQTLYMTHSYNNFALEMSTLAVSVPSSITDVGYRAMLSRRALTAGAEVVSHMLHPQNPKVDGLFQVQGVAQPLQHTLEASLFADYTLRMGPLELVGGLRTTYYHYADYRRLSASPSVSLTCDMGRYGLLSLRSSVKHQYLHRSGFSDMGLPTEFWFSADSRFPAQYAWNLSAGIEQWLHGRMYHVSIEGYYKRLFHQQEYSGNIFDVLYTAYDLETMLLHGRGCNYGINVLVEKRKGALTGWLSYSVGRAMRRFDDARYSGWYPANHERIHELNMVGTYQLSRRWSVGGTYVLASGTPFTAPRKFYLLNENLISVFGEHNAQRLRPYMRLDLSANYDFPTRSGRRSGINLSVYNVTMNNNDLYYRLKLYQGRFAAKPFRFMLSIMPSINYYYQF